MIVTDNAANQGKAISDLIESLQKGLFSGALTLPFSFLTIYSFSSKK